MDDSTTRKAHRLSYFYLVLCLVPAAIMAVGSAWASGQSGFAAWGILGFILAAGAVGVANLLLGAVALFATGTPLRLRLAVVLGFVVGGVIPTLYLGFVLTQ